MVQPLLDPELLEVKDRALGPIPHWKPLGSEPHLTEAPLLLGHTRRGLKEGLSKVM